MKRVNIIKIDMVLLDEETGDYEYRAKVNKDFINYFNIDSGIIQDGLNLFMKNFIVEKETE